MFQLFRYCIVSAAILLDASASSAQNLKLDPPLSPEWPKYSSVDTLAASLVREANILDANAKSPSAQAAWRRMAATLLHTHGAAPLANSTPAAIALVMVAIRRDIDTQLNTPAGELFAAEWNARPNKDADAWPEFARLMSALAEMPSAQEEAVPCAAAKELLQKIIPLAKGASTAPDLAQDAFSIVSAANNAAAALCALQNANYWNAQTRENMSDQINVSVKGLIDPATRKESVEQCEKFGALAQAINALQSFRALAASSNVARSDRIPDALRLLLSQKNYAESTLALLRIAKIINFMTEARQFTTDSIAAPLRNAGRSLTRKAVASESQGLTRIETLTLSGFNPNDPALSSIFAAQEQLVQDIHIVQRLSLALNQSKAKSVKQTKQLIDVMQAEASGLDDKTFSELFRERLRAMDRQLDVLNSAELMAQSSPALQAECDIIRQRWLDAWGAKDAAKGLKSISEFARWANAKRALNALDSAPVDWPDARFDWQGSRDALRQCVSDGEGALISDNIAVMKPFLAPLKSDAAASLAAGLRLSALTIHTADAQAIVRQLCELHNDKSIQVLAALLRLEQERQTLLKTNQSLAEKFLKARNEWVDELPPGMHDQLPDGMLPPATP